MDRFRFFVKYALFITTLVVSSYGLWMLITDGREPLALQFENLEIQQRSQIGSAILFFLFACLFRFDVFIGILFDFFDGIRWIYYFGWRKKAPLHSPDEDRLVNG